MPHQKVLQIKADTSIHASDYKTRDPAITSGPCGKQGNDQPVPQASSVNAALYSLEGVCHFLRSTPYLD
ncbi:MAG: hypothetical protein ABW157_07005 [Candidatus Thiodiazotropha sp. LLP2]